MSTISIVEPDAEQQAGKKVFRVLMVSGVYPTEQLPHKGTFIKSQVDSLLAAGLEVEVIHPKPGPVPLRYASASMQVFWKTLMGKYDIVHGHYGLWCLITRLQWTTPVVASFLGDDLLGTVTAEGHYSSKGAFVARVSRWLSRHVDAVIVKSEGMKKVASAGDTVFVIPNGVDFEQFRPIPRAEARAALGWEPDRYYILFCNDPAIPVKNYPLAWAAVENLRARGTSAELVVASGIPYAKIPLYMNASNALILSSLAEGSPNVVKEAMACCIPVVASDVGDVAEVIGHTQGCTVCPLDPGAFAEGLQVALEHQGPTTGRADIAHLESSEIAKQVIAVYKRVASNQTTRQKAELAQELEKESMYGKNQ